MHQLEFLEQAPMARLYDAYCTCGWQSPGAMRLNDVAALAEKHRITERA